MQIKTLCAVAALLAAPYGVMAQAYLDNTTVGNVTTAQVNNTGFSTTSAYLDIEGTANGKTGSPGYYETFGLIDFGSIYYGPNQALQNNFIDLNLTDSPFSSVVDGKIDISLVTSPVANLTSSNTTLKYSNPPASINLPIVASYYATPNSVNYNLLPAGNNYISNGGTTTGGNYDYTASLPPAAVSYFNSVLNNPNGDLQLLVTADASTPSVYTGFDGGAFPQATSPYIGFNTVPEPGAATPLLVGLGAIGLFAARRRARA